MINRHDIISFDVETKGKADLYGLQPCRALTGDAWLTTCAMAYWDGDAIATDGLVAPAVDQLSDWLDSVIAAKQYVVCWNSAFDIAWLIALGLRDKVRKVRWLDGILIQRHLINAPRFRPDGKLSMGLKQTVERHRPDSAGYGDDIDFDDESPENVAKLLTYNELDAFHTLDLACDFLSQLPEQVVRNLLVEAACLADVAETYVMGIKVNPAAAQALGQKLEEQRRLAFMTLKLGNPNDVSEEVLASPKKLGELLFKKWGLPVVNLTETDQPSTDKASLIELAVLDPRAMQVHEYRDATNCKAKFCDSPLASLAYNGDGVTRPQARVFGTYTGRMTYSSKTGKGVAEQPTGVALHQWKRDPEFRALIEPPEGYDLIEFDFAGQEFRWMAVESGDHRMLQLCMPGEDAHSYMGAQASGDDYRWLQKHAGDDRSEHYKVAKAKRQLGKVGNLSLQYRTSPPTLVKVAAVQHKMKLTLPEAKALHATYLTTYRKVPEYWRRQIKLARAMGFVQTLAGRRVHLGHESTWTFTTPDGEVVPWKWGHESTAINFPIQGIGADQKYLGLLCMHSLLTKYDAKFYFELHDGMFFVCPKAYSEHFVREGKVLLSNLPYRRAWGVNLPIQFPVDAKLGPSWGQLKEVH